ncbi:hypothetical protein Tco_0525873 [Tanacetum coccineum]
MPCYLTGMEPYYIKCIKDGPFHPKTAEDDIMESVIRCETTKATWTDLVHSFEDFQENSDDESSQPAQNSQNEQKIQKDYNTKYKKMKVKLLLLEASPSTYQNPKTFQSKNKGLVAETFDWDEEEVANNEELTQVKVLMALGDDELTSPWDIDHEMVPKSKDWVERHNPDSKLPNFNTGRILVLESQAVNECLKLTEASNDP